MELAYSSLDDRTPDEVYYDLPHPFKQAAWGLFNFLFFWRIIWLTAQVVHPFGVHFTRAFLIVKFFPVIKKIKPLTWILYNECF
jgi:hypothetical protein